MTYPNTIATDVIRRLGMSDVYSLTPGGVITCSVDKRGGLYSGSVIYTTDALITKNSAWIAVSVSDTVDVVDVAIPAAATGVAFICAAITDTATPRVGAAFSVKDAQTAHSRSRHLRFRYASGDGAQVAFTPLLLPPDDFVNWYDFTDKGVLYSDVNRTSLISGAQSESVLGVKDKGSSLNDLESSFGNAIGPLFQTDLASEGFSGLRFDRIDATNGAGLRSVSNESLTSTCFMMAVGAMQVAPAAIGILYQGPIDPGDQIFRIQTGITFVRVEAFNGKKGQTWTFATDTLFGGWAENAGSAVAASINKVAGTTGKGTGISPPNDQHSFGTTIAGTGTFGTGSLYELAVWNTVNPSRSSIEAYITTKYAAVWA